nr:recombinase family protein [Corynebacterium caspium]
MSTEGGLSPTQSIRIGYARVSSADQNLSRQIEALKAEGVEERFIFTDKVSGASRDNRDGEQHQSERHQKADRKSLNTAAKHRRLLANTLQLALRLPYRLLQHLARLVGLLRSPLNAITLSNLPLRYRLMNLIQVHSASKRIRHVASVQLHLMVSFDFGRQLLKG